MRPAMLLVGSLGGPGCCRAGQGLDDASARLEPAPGAETAACPVGTAVPILSLTCTLDPSLHVTVLWGTGLVLATLLLLLFFLTFVICGFSS